MREQQFSILDSDSLDQVHGGQDSGSGEQSTSPNYQHDVIGVQAGDVVIGWERKGGRNDYGRCLDLAAANNWTPEQIATTCNPLHSDGN